MLYMQYENQITIYLKFFKTVTYKCICVFFNKFVFSLAEHLTYTEIVTLNSRKY